MWYLHADRSHTLVHSFIHSLKPERSHDAVRPPIWRCREKSEENGKSNASICWAHPTLQLPTTKKPIRSIMVKVGWCVDHSGYDENHGSSKLPQLKSSCHLKTIIVMNDRVCISPSRALPLDTLLPVVAYLFLLLPNEQWFSPSAAKTKRTINLSQKHSVRLTLFSSMNVTASRDCTVWQRSINF